MGFEVEFFPVGEASKAGDAIIVRYGWDDKYAVVIIDAGTDQSGEAIVNHVRAVYGNVVAIDVINTHPDNDHSCGLRHVLRELPVNRLWVHGLWHHAPQILHLFDNPRLTVDGLAKTMRSEYSVIAELLDIAAQKKIDVGEPFAGTTIGPFRVLSPNAATYQHLLPQFRKTPAPNVEALKAQNIWLGEQQESILGAFLAKASETLTEWIPERWDTELLREGGITAAENESSAVLYGDFGDGKILLTGDAGVNALSWACNNAQQMGIDLTGVEFVQVPHHGSRRNVSPSVLDRIVGPRRPHGAAHIKKAVVSAPKDDEAHPRKMVLNAFTRRGAGVYTTQGVKFRYHVNMPARFGENDAQPFGFFDRVEAYD